MNKLERTTFEVSRELEFFSEKELQMQIGHGRQLWPIAVLKELIDNSLDACETADIAPVVEVKIESNGFSVRDNGPGLPQETLVRSLDFMKRVSDKAFYIAPTRGQLGNALKTVWAAPFVVNGERGQVEVWSWGQHHTVAVSTDRIAQMPRIEHSIEESDFVKNGCLFYVHWEESASCFSGEKSPDFYNAAQELVQNYAAFNPHATFRLNELTFEATDTEWHKWKPSDPTSPHWYTPETLRDLIAAYISGEKLGERARTVREFVSEFRGLSSTSKQKQATGNLSGAYLHDLISNGDVDMAIVELLLKTMKKLSRPPKPATLGVIGQEHMKAWMTRYAGVIGDSVRYSKRLGDDAVPHVIEVAFGIREEGSRRLVTGLNWAPTLGSPVEEFSRLLGEMRIDSHDPVTVVMHLARPRFDFTDRGKGRLQL